MSSPKSETNQVPLTQDQETENLQQTNQEEIQAKVDNSQTEKADPENTENNENTNKTLDESSALNKSGDKTAKKKTKKKAKKEEEANTEILASATEGEGVKEPQAEADKTENKDEPAEKKPKKKKKTAEKIEIPSADGTSPQQEEKPVEKKPKKKAAKANAETALASAVVADVKPESDDAPKEEPVKENKEAGSKAPVKAKVIEATPVKTKPTSEGTKKPETIKLSATKAPTKEDAKSPAKLEKSNTVTEQNKPAAKTGGESERLNLKPNQQSKTDSKTAGEKPVNLKEQSVTSPAKNKNGEKKVETTTPGKAKQSQQEVQKVNENDKKNPNKKGKNEAETNNNNILEGLTPTIKEPKTPENTKSAKKVSVNETAREMRSISPRKQVKGSQKPRQKSFDAGKTQKVDPNDSFDTRAKVWEIRKKEKLLEQEKKYSRREIEECTFSPALNKKSLSKLNLTGDFLQRNAEWSEKHKVTLQFKTEKYLEDTMKPEIRKSKAQPTVGSSTRLYEVQRAPNAGALRGVNFEMLNHEPIGVPENLNEKLAEINDIYDNISSALKAKSARNRGEDVQRVARPITMDSSRKAQPYAYPSKTITTKVVSTTSTEEVNRLDSLKSMLISNKKKDQPKSIVDSNNAISEVYLTEAKNAQDYLKKPTKHLEIRNNRYVMVDNDLSAIEKREHESKDISLNLETA